MDEISVLILQPIAMLQGLCAASLQLENYHA
jgi:hypothetical protein